MFVRGREREGGSLRKGVKSETSWTRGHGPDDADSSRLVVFASKVLRVSHVSFHG